MSKKYNRYFLIFNEEDKGFEVSGDKQPTGYTKIETRNGNCKITVYAQNLRTDKGPYTCYLVDSSKNPAKVARLGELSVDESGKGETLWEQDAKNIFGTGLSSDQFNIAAVVKEGNRLQVPLAGYLGKDKVEWRNKVNSRSFEYEEEEPLRSEEESPSPEKKSLKSDKKSSSKKKRSSSKKKESLNPEVKDDISEIFEKAESEVIEENKEIVEEARSLSEEYIEASDADVVDSIFEGSEENIETSDVVLDSISEVDERKSDFELLDINVDEQLRRNDDDYVESYTEEGIKFKHYEDDINLQSADIEYAGYMTRELEEKGYIDAPYVNRMSIFEDEIDFRNLDKEYDDEEYLCDARDIVAQSIDYEPGILYRVMDRVNIDRSNLCKETKADLDKLDHEIKKEFNKCLDKELKKYKEALLKNVCKKPEKKSEKKKGEHKGSKKHKDHLDLASDKWDDCKHEDKWDDCQIKAQGLTWESGKHEHHDKHHGHHGHHHDHHGENKNKGYAKILHKLLEDFTEVNVKGAKDCRFWKVDESDKFPKKDNSMYPYHSAIHHLKMTYPYINYIKYFKAKGFYYFGIKYDKMGEVKYLIYGIVGEKKESHQPYKGMTGFVSWTPHESSGIWMMHYNPYTGCVMLPKSREKDKK